jgi:DKNYY family
MRRFIASAAAACAVFPALLGGCSRSEEPNSLFDDAGYHVRDDTVYYLNPFPGKAFAVEEADSSTFRAFDRTYARDHLRVFVNGHPLHGADAHSFQLLDGPGFAKDRDRVYRHDTPISSDPDHFRLIAADLARDSANVYRSDGTVLSGDPENFMIISDRDHYLFAKDSSSVFVNGTVIAGASPAAFQLVQGAYSKDDTGVFYFDGQIDGADVATFRPLTGPYAVDATRVYWMGRPIEGADPATFAVLNANFECSADGALAFYRDMVIAGADPSTFPPDRQATGCSQTTISFGG